MNYKVEVIGDVAVMKPRYGSEVDMNEAYAFAEKLLASTRHVRSVWLAVSPVGSLFKVRKLAYLAGEPRTETIYREHGCSLLVNVGKDFISPRLSYEHLRVARLITDGEVVVNMFAGIGLFSIIAAKHSRPRKVHSIDISPDAYNKMVYNILINRVEDKVVPYLGDAGQVVASKLVGVADRVLMPLPDVALQYLPYALMALRGEGVIHVYLHLHAAKGESVEEKAKALIDRRLKELNVRWRPELVREVRMVGPRFYQVVVDARVWP